jgi:hypothetical protein
MNLNLKRDAFEWHKRLYHRKDLEKESFALETLRPLRPSGIIVATGTAAARCYDGTWFVQISIVVTLLRLLQPIKLC